MANFMTTVLSAGRVKEGFDRGSQGVVNSLVHGMPEGFATKFLGFRTLSGVGLINPLLGIFTEPAYSAVKQLVQSGVQPLLGKQPATTLPAVTTDTPAAAPGVAVVQETVSRLPGGGVIFKQPPRAVQSTLLQRFPALREEGDSVLGKPGTALIPDGEDPKFPAVVSPNVIHRGTDPLINPGLSNNRSFANRGRTERTETSLGRQAIKRYQVDSGGGGTSVGSITEEFLQQHRFLVYDDSNDALSVFEWSTTDIPNTLAAGFSYCSSPTMAITVEAVKEGTWEFPRSIPTGVEAGKLTLQKGIVRVPTSFYLWLVNALAGKLTRRTLWVASYGRYGRQASEKEYTGWADPSKLYDVASSIWKFVNCIPIVYKAGQDWDARSGEVQVAELEIAYEWFEESERALK